MQMVPFGSDTETILHIFSANNKIIEAMNIVPPADITAPPTPLTVSFIAKYLS